MTWVTDKDRTACYKHLHKEAHQLHANIWVIWLLYWKHSWIYAFNWLKSLHWLTLSWLKSCNCRELASGQSIASTHGAVLALAASVLSVPYDMPRYVFEMKSMPSSWSYVFSGIYHVKAILAIFSMEEVSSELSVCMGQAGSYENIIGKISGVLFIVRLWSVC